MSRFPICPAPQQPTETYAYSTGGTAERPAEAACGRGRFQIGGQHTICQLPLMSCRTVERTCRVGRVGTLHGTLRGGHWKGPGLRW